MAVTLFFLRVFGTLRNAELNFRLVGGSFLNPTLSTVVLISDGSSAHAAHTCVLGIGLFDMMFEGLC